MQRVKLIKTGKVKSVEEKEAHNLVEAGQAEYVNDIPHRNQSYNTRKMRAGQIATK